MSTTPVPGLRNFDPLSLTHFQDRLSHDLGLELYAQRDDLMPLPFGGNKWIKIAGILGSGQNGTAYISNGGVDSNHCRAMAAWGAINNRQCHFVLHGHAGEYASASAQMLTRLGATFEIVSPDEISATVEVAKSSLERSGKRAVVVPGGGHSLQGALSFSEHAVKVVGNLKPEFVVFASGTGGTQAGIIHATQTQELFDTRVIGVSVARAADRGRMVIEETLAELGLDGAFVDFRGDYRGEGYGRPTDGAIAAIELAERRGLLLDPIYTGKAFHGLLDLVASEEIPRGSKVMFWHTGGEYLATQHRDELRSP